MANWKYTLDIKDIWSKMSGHEITIQEGSLAVAQALGELIKTMKRNEENENEVYDLEEIAYNFSDLERYDNVDVDDFDGLMDELYDWADCNLVWVATF